MTGNRDNLHHDGLHREGNVLELRNETAVNVVGLLRLGTGETRHYRLVLDRFPLDDGLAAEDIEGEVRLTRLREAIIAAVEASGVVKLECVRCLRIYDQEFSVSFSEEFRQSVDLRTGILLDPAEDEDVETSLINENHELDLAEVLRQEILVSLPMRPYCGDLCPGPDVTESGTGEEPVDARFSALAGLLEDDESGS